MSVDGLSANMKYQMITTIEKCVKDLEYREKNLICKKAFSGIELTGSNSNDFAIKNGWKVADEKSMFGASYTSFDILHGNNYFKYTCKKCGSIFNSPIELNECIVCNEKEIGKEKKSIRKAMIQDTINIHPDLYKQAVEDIREHPIKQEPSVDWEHLAREIGD